MPETYFAPLARKGIITLVGILIVLGNYFQIVSDRDFQRLTKEKLYLINNQIKLKDCSKDRERMLASLSVQTYTTLLSQANNCIKENQAKFTVFNYFVLEDCLSKLLAYQDELAKIEPSLFIEKTIKKEIDLLLSEYETSFLIFDSSLQEFQADLFMVLFLRKYLYWIFIYPFMILGIIMFWSGDTIEEDNITTL